jgi:transcriptional regulator with XRE-family HTH domain
MQLWQRQGEVTFGGAAVKTFGEVIAEGRVKAGLTQRELAARIKTEKGRPISAPYINDLEHNLRHPPRGYLLEEFAKHLEIDPDLLYFLSGRLPRDVVPEKASEQQVLAAYRAFRRELKSRSNKR